MRTPLFIEERIIGCLRDPFHGAAARISRIIGFQALVFEDEGEALLEVISSHDAPNKKAAQRRHG
jgi:hypothetical protein